MRLGKKSPRTHKGQTRKQTEEPKLVSEKQAARLLGVCRITLLRERQRGHLRHYRVGTRVLYDPEMLLADLEQNKAAAKAA